MFLRLPQCSSGFLSKSVKGLLVLLTRMLARHAQALTVAGLVQSKLCNADTKAGHLIRALQQGGKQI